ncbi:MAG: TssQ family T6SS-associated lipoprotein [Gallionellaceae bacterium]|nr:TssQ family T6SS-associated lipoprotein [Gallionellaceae bacterium]
MSVRSKTIFVIAMVFFMLSGCSNLQRCEQSPEVRLFRTPTEFMVNVGIKSFEDGNYAGSEMILQNLLDSKNSTKNEKVLANKYLAFMHCLSPKDEKRQCREHFNKIFETNPNFELTPAEASHPMWGPVFRSAKEKQVK